jgi:hypothetical protein
MLTVTLKEKNKPDRTVEVPLEIEAAGGAAIDAYVAATPSARTTQLATARAGVAARAKAHDDALKAALVVSAPDAPTTSQE